MSHGTAAGFFLSGLRLIKERGGELLTSAPFFFFFSTFTSALVFELSLEFKRAAMQASKMNNFHWLLQWLCPSYPRHAFLCVAPTKKRKRLGGGVGRRVGGGFGADGQNKCTLCCNYRCAPTYPRGKLAQEEEERLRGREGSQQSHLLSRRLPPLLMREAL